MAVLSIGQVWAESVTFSAVYANQDKPTSYEGTDFSISFDKNGGNATQYYNTGNALRAYAKNSWTFSSTKTITGIAFTFGTGDGSNTITASTGTYANGSWEGSATEITFTIGGTSGHRRIASVEVTFASGPSDACAAPTFSPAAGAVLSGTEVSISCATEGATVHYTLDESEPTASSATAQPISITSATTIKAIAVKEGANNSAIATAAYTVVTPLATMDAIFAAAATAGNYYITFSDEWVVTGVSSNGKTVYLSDGTKGLILYNSANSIGLTAGQTLSGTKQCALTLYGGASEITSFTTDGLTVGSGTLPSVQELDEAGVAALGAVNTGALIKVSGEYTAAGYVGGAKLYNAIMALPTMTVGSTYECTGVYIYYKKNNTTDAVPEIAPRTTTDIEEVQAATLDEVTGLAALKAAERGSYYVNLTNAVVSYVNGNNALIEDANAGALIYLSNHGFNAGDCLNGKYQVTTTDHQGKFEITAIEAQTGATKTTAEIPLTTLTITQLNANFSSYESRRVKIVGANVTDAISGDDRNGAINDGAAVAVYAAAGNNVITLTADDNVDIIGYPGYYNTNEQLNVWAMADITVNSSEPPVVDPRKVAESPEGGFSSVSGNLSGNEISFAAYQGGSATAPNGNNTANELRLYKYQESTNYGGYVTITAKTGCTIDQVVITVGGNCKVGYCKDAENFPTKEATPINVSTSNPFDTDKDLGASSVNVVNLDGSNQFKIKTITVYYTGEGIDLESIAISGDASVLEYTEGDAFNPAGLSVIGHYSDNSEAEITEGITWAFDPATLSTTDESVSVTATVGELTSAAVVVNGLTVSAAVAPTPSTDNVVILATHGTKLYAMSTTNSNNAFAAIVVEEDGSNIVVTSEEAKAAIQWTRSSNGITATFQDANSKYLTATNGSTNLSLGEDECVWKWYAGEGKNCYSIENEDETKLRSFLYYSNNGIFKNYALSNAGGNYSGIAEVRVIAAENIVVVVPATHTLSYNPNGGTLMEGEDAIADAQVAEGAQVTVAANVYEKEGYVFAGWQYGETVYNAGQKFNMPTTDVELVAQWATISTDNVVIIAQSLGQWYAIQAEAGTANHTVKAVPIVYENNTIYLVESKRASITWERKSAGAQASFKNGTNYLSGKTSDSNDLDLGADECWWTFNSTSNIYQTHADHSLLYSESAGVFKNYKSSNAGKTGYSALPIVVPAVFGDPSYEIVRQELVPNAYYTMCLEKAVDAVQGGSIWRVLSKAQNDKDIILEEVTGTLQAGRPYIFYATASELQVVYAGAAVLEEVNDEANNGLIGSFIQTKITQSDDNYIIYNNALYFVNSDNVYVGAHRAYLDMTGVPAYSNEPQQGNAPRRRVTMTVYNEQTTTGIDALNASETPVKVIIEGKLYIIRGEKMYNANGQLVK